MLCEIMMSRGKMMLIDPVYMSREDVTKWPITVEIQQEGPSENEAPTLGWSLKLFLGVCLFKIGRAHV